jgi:hypothetical protein
MSDVDRLGTVERYFVEVKDIPRLAERIRCFIFTRTYAATRVKVGGWGDLRWWGLAWTARAAGRLAGSLGWSLGEIAGAAGLLPAVPARPYLRACNKAGAWPCWLSHRLGAQRCAGAGHLACPPPTWCPPPSPRSVWSI